MSVLQREKQIWKLDYKTNKQTTQLQKSPRQQGHHFEDLAETQPLARTGDVKLCYTWSDHPSIGTPISLGKVIPSCELATPGMESNTFWRTWGCSLTQGEIATPNLLT